MKAPHRGDQLSGYLFIYYLLSQKGTKFYSRGLCESQTAQPSNLLAPLGNNRKSIRFSAESAAENQIDRIDQGVVRKKWLQKSVNRKSENTSHRVSFCVLRVC